MEYNKTRIRVRVDIDSTHDLEVLQVQVGPPGSLDGMVQRSTEVQKGPLGLHVILSWLMVSGPHLQLLRQANS